MNLNRFGYIIYLDRKEITAMKENIERRNIYKYFKRSSRIYETIFQVENGFIPYNPMNI
jgi:hypothetical protein